ncbi:MAG: hypothetical protein JSS29_16505 [Proteobacteria bacterium]|nr:hypothetical protein [Pseudomonadota bacterium]
MEAASRPPLEPLTDLPVEAPLDGPAQPKAAVTPAATPAPAAKDPAQTGITFLDPASLVLEGAEGAEPPVVAAAPVAPAAPELELVLEDPAVVEELLTTPPPAPPKPAVFVSEPAPTLTPSAPPSSATVNSGAKPEPRPDVRVPIMKTAALSAAATKVAATKLAAATKRAETAPRATIPTIPPAKPAPAAAAAKPVRPPATPGAPAPAAAPPAAEGLAGWTSARAAAAPAAKPKSSAAVAAPAPKAAPAAAKPAAAKPAPSAEAAASAAPATMDRDYIARNQIVERYLSGRLPLKGATDFEQFVAKHPDILDEIGLPERVNAGLRLLEASGKPEPWQEPARPAWQKPQVTVALAVVVALLGVALLVLTGATTSKNRRIAQLQKQVADQPLDPATSTREIRVLPSREGASNSPAITIGGGGAQLADFKIDESRSPYHVFRVTIDRIDQGRVGIISNLEKDSNGHLRIALNSTALGPGNYQLTIEGLNWRGDSEPDSWVTIGIAR